MPISIVTPQMGESIVEGSIGKWVKKVGDKVERDEVIVEILTDKVTVEVPSGYAGVMGKILAEQDEVVQVGQVLAILLREGEDESAMEGMITTPAQTTAAATMAATAAPAKGGTAATSAAPAVTPTGPVRTSPAIRRQARDLGIDLSTVPATGPKGRILKLDLDAFVAGQGTRVSPAPATAGRPVPMAPLAADEQVEKTPFGGVRKMIADRMLNSVRVSPHVMVMDEVDLTLLVDFRNRHKARIKMQYGVKLTYMAFFAKATAAALKNHPTLNASLTDSEVILKKFYHIGIAVARDEGLIVPVVKHADTKGILQLAGEIADLAERARNDTLKPDDVAGGTFTLTNAGMFGALASTPIINQPQVGILGIHAIQKRPVVRDGNIVARDMMYLTLSFDHRLVDGHSAAQFLHEICENLREPANMLLV